MQHVLKRSQERNASLLRPKASTQQNCNLEEILKKKGDAN